MMDWDELKLVMGGFISWVNCLDLELGLIDCLC